MGRYDTLNADTQDLINCLLPALAASFGLTDAVDIIPGDIRMRAWDCERRDHIKDQTENDPRNWGVQFLKDLMAISRIKKGDLETFQADLYAKVALHEEKHPWARLSDIKEIRDEYEHPDRPPPVVDESAGTSSTDSYLEELHEPDLPPGMNRGRRGHHEIYEARVQESHKRRKYGRLRRSEEGGFMRVDKTKGRSSKGRYSSERATPNNTRRTIRRPSRRIDSDDEDFNGEFNDARPKSFQQHPTPSFSMSPAPARLPAAIVQEVDNSDVPVAVQKLQAELEVAEAELKAARLKHTYLEAKEAAEKEAKSGKSNKRKAPSTMD